MANICNLPAELLHEIISDLDDPSLINLSLTCKTLHYISLNTFFKKNGNRLVADGWFMAYRPVAGTLYALRAALWVKDFKQLHYSFNSGIDDPVAEIMDMFWFVKRLSSIKKVGFCISDTRLLVRRRWCEAFTRLLELVIERGCTDLEVSGRGVLAMEQELLAPNDTLGTQKVAETRMSTSRGVESGQRVSNSSNGQGLQGSKIHSTNKGRKKGRPLKYCSQAKWYHLLQRKSWQKTGTTGLTKQSNSYATELVDAVEETKSEAPRRVRLTKVRISCPMLLQPTFKFLDWTIKTIVPNSITQLSLWSLDIPTQSWSAFLASLTLPHLGNFEIMTNCVNGATFMELLDFWDRHPTIHTVHLQGLDGLPTFPKIQRPIFPNVVSIVAQPGWICALLDMRDSKGSLLKLDSITITTEYLSRNSNLDCDLFDAALLCIANLSGRKITLSLLFRQEGGVLDWFSKHAALGKENSILGRMDCVSTLEVSSFYVDFIKSDLTTWFNLFPCVEHIELPWAKVELEKSEYLKDIAEKCPKVKSVGRWGKKFRLDKYRGQMQGQQMHRSVFGWPPYYLNSR